MIDITYSQLHLVCPIKFISFLDHLLLLKNQPSWHSKHKRSRYQNVKCWCFSHSCQVQLLLGLAYLKGTQKTRLTFLKGLVKMKISKPVRHSFIFGTQIKIFLMISESSQTLHWQQCNCNIPSPSLPPFWKLPWRVRTLSSERNQCNQRCLCSGESAHMLNVNNTDYVDYVLGKAHACVMVLSKMAEDGNSGRRIVEKNVLFVFFAQKVFS